mgnify:CR=1 FL=1|jgi:hypothetical protein|tara:strand:- start:1040 stop:1876 length:837 start_codon:yes stop_codon:yes gene_type:complete
MKTMESLYYGDNFRWFLGVVINTADPLQLGRSQIRIYGIHPDEIEDLPSDALPWAQVMVPCTEGGSSGIGKMPQLIEGARVVGFFMDGASSQVPLVIGTIPFVEDPSPQQIQALSNGDASLQTSAEGVTNFIRGGTNVEKAFNFFIATNFTTEQASGMIAGLVEASTDKMLPDIDADGSYGIAQWPKLETEGNRYQNLLYFAGNRGLQPTSIEAQLQFVLYELRTYPYLGLGQLKRTRTVSEAAEIFSTKYQTWTAQTPARKAARKSKAQEIFGRFTR